MPWREPESCFRREIRNSNQSYCTYEALILCPRLPPSIIVIEANASLPPTVILSEAKDPLRNPIHIGGPSARRLRMTERAHQPLLPYRFDLFALTSLL